MRKKQDGEVHPLKLVPRRDVIKGAAVTAGGLGATVASFRGVNAGTSYLPEYLQHLTQGVEATPEGFTPSALTAEELVTLTAIQNRLIPSDEHGPGAGESGAYIYVDRTLSGPGSATLSMYQEGLRAINNEAGREGFESLSEDDQDAILVKLEAGELPNSPAGFFFTLLSQTRQGMFCDPMYGGNIGFAGWDLIGYPGHKFVYTEEEQTAGTVIEPAHRSIAESGGTPYGSTS